MTMRSICRNAIVHSRVVPRVRFYQSFRSSRQTALSVAILDYSITLSRQLTEKYIYILLFLFLIPYDLLRYICFYFIYTDMCMYKPLLHIFCWVVPD